MGFPATKMLSAPHQLPTTPSAPPMHPIAVVRSSTVFKRPHDCATAIIPHLARVRKCFSFSPPRHKHRSLLQCRLPLHSQGCEFQPSWKATTRTHICSSDPWAFVRLCVTGFSGLADLVPSLLPQLQRE